jgi:hypothetical protein
MKENGWRAYRVEAQARIGRAVVKRLDAVQHDLADLGADVCRALALGLARKSIAESEATINGD